MTNNRKPILYLNFDGVIDSYTSGWKGADVIPDQPVPGAIAFIIDAVGVFEVHIFSSRSGIDGGENVKSGICAMQDWLHKWVIEFWEFDQMARRNEAECRAVDLMAAIE